MAARRAFFAFSLCVAMDLALVLEETTAAAACPHGDFQHVYSPDTCFYIGTATRTWADAKDDCEDRGGMLAEPENANMDNFIYDLALSYTSTYSTFYWLGLHDSQVEGTWMWASDNSGLIYENWNTLPDGGVGENCGRIRASAYLSDVRGWYDGGCSYTSRYVCQYGPRTDGGWSRFAPFSECSTTCGYGVRTRNRTCTRPSPAFGGQQCQGPAISATSCKDNPPCTDPCTLKPCKNGGTCTNLDENSRHCQCLSGYTKPDCEACSCWTDDDCDRAPCLTVVLLYLMLILIAVIGSVIAAVLYKKKMKAAGRAWTKKSSPSAGTAA